MTLRLFTLGLEIGALTFWTFVWLNARYLDGPSSAGVVKQLVSVVIVITGSITMSTLVALNRHTSPSPSAYTNAFAGLASVSMGAAIILVIHAKKIAAQRPGKGTYHPLIGITGGTHGERTAA